MIKPIIYRDIREKETLERNLMAPIPLWKREMIAKAIADFFSSTNKVKEEKNKKAAIRDR